MKTSRLSTLQAMRFFAALCVLQYHLWQNYLGIAIGHPGTDFFLVLVGLVAAYSQAKAIRQGNWLMYISGRYRRLYVSFIPLFIITLFAKRSEMNFSWAWRSFLFIPTPGRLPVIGATWMISMFLLFYFVFSLCFLVRTEKILWLLFGLWGAGILLYNFFGLKTGLPDHWEDLVFNERNLDFIFGYGAGVVLRKGGLHGRQAWLLLLVGFLGIAAGTTALNLGYSLGRAFFVGIPVALFTLGLGALEIQKPETRLVRWLTAPWLVWLGGTSYVLYLSHSIFFQGWSMLLPVSYTWVLPMTMGAVAAAAAGYLFWEAPILAYLKTGVWKLPPLPASHFGMEGKIHNPGD
jgi:peptidoglycan/LPS O-acetylase OafA/YrhL